jgi:beta-glucosidase
LKEKAALICDIFGAVPYLGIKSFNWCSEALHRLANNNNVTIFPKLIGMAVPFFDQLVYLIFTAASDETCAKYNEAIQKGQEIYGEDPFLMFGYGLSYATLSIGNA